MTLLKAGADPRVVCWVHLNPASYQRMLTELADAVPDAMHALPIKSVIVSVVGVAPRKRIWLIILVSCRHRSITSYTIRVVFPNLGWRGVGGGGGVKHSRFNLLCNRLDSWCYQVETLGNKCGEKKVRSGVK